MAKIKAAKPDVLWTSTSGTVFATVMHSMTNVGLDIPVLTTTANASAAQLKPLNTFLPRELYFNGVPFQLGDLLRDAELRRQAKVFADAFKGIGVEATPLHALAWDPLLIAVSALQRLGPGMTADQLKTYVLGLRNFTGLNGKYDFSSGDQHGLDSNAVVIVGWNRDKQDFFPASQTGGVPIKP